MDQASFSLDSLPPSDSACPHCGKSEHSVSHGYLYKHISIDRREIVGKRILCSQRNGRQGCSHRQRMSSEPAFHLHLGRELSRLVQLCCPARRCVFSLGSQWFHRSAFVLPAQNAQPDRAPKEVDKFHEYCFLATAEWNVN